MSIGQTVMGVLYQQPFSPCQFSSAAWARKRRLRLTAPLVIWEYVLVAVALAVLHRTDLKRSAWVAALLWALSSLVRIGWYWTAT